MVAPEWMGAPDCANHRFNAKRISACLDMTFFA
jgi:hypothetical protein